MATNLFPDLDLIPEPEPEPQAKGPRAIVDLVNREADRFNVPRSWAHAVARMESGYNPRAQSPVGAAGVMQLMPGTARDLGVKNRFDPVENVRGGVKYLAQLRNQFGDNPRLVLAAYNAGPGRVQQYRGVPPFRETRNYVAQGTRLIAQARPQPTAAPVQETANEAAPAQEPTPAAVPRSINPYEEMPPAPAPAAAIPEVRSTITYATDDPFAGLDVIPEEQPRTPSPAPAAFRAPPGSGGAQDFLRGLIVNPLRGLFETGKRIVAGPESTGELVRDIGQSHLDTAKKAAEAWRAGNRSEAVGYALATALPLLGPAAAGIGEKIGSGQVAEGLGEASTMLLTMPTPGRAVARGTGRAAATTATATGGAIRGGFKEAVKPRTAGEAGAAWMAGQVFGPQAGATIGATLTGRRVARGAVRGAREALKARASRAAEALAAEREAAAAARAASVPEPIITRVPEPASMPLPPERGLPAGREAIITPAPEIPPDTSFVRSVPAELPEVIPPALRTKPAAATAAEQLREEMIRSGTIAAEEAKPVTPKSGAEKIIEARNAKAERFLDPLERFEFSAANAQQFGPSEWEAFAKAIGEDVPSADTIKQILFRMRKRKPPASERKASTRRLSSPER